MNITRVLLAAIIAAVVAFFLGWLVYGMLLDPWFQANSIKYEGLMKNPPVLWAIFLSNLCWTLLLAYVFNRWANINTVMPGIMAGMIISFLICASMDISYYAFMNLMRIRVLAVDTVVGTLFGGVLGGVVAFVLGWGKKD